VLDAELEQLPENYRLPIILFHLEGRRQIEVADALGTKQSTVAKRLKRGREILRSRLASRGIVVGSASFAIMLSTETVSATPFDRPTDGGPTTLPFEFVESTTTAVKSLANGETNAGTSLHSLELANRTLRRMTMGRLRTAVAVGGAALVLTLAVFTLWNHSLWNHSLWNHSLWNHSLSDHSFWNHGFWNHGFWNHNGLAIQNPLNQASSLNPLGADELLSTVEKGTAESDSNAYTISTLVDDEFDRPTDLKNEKSELKVTPLKSDTYELQRQLMRERVFLHMVRSPWRDYGGWNLKVPKEQIGREQSVDQLLRVMAADSKVKMTSVRNAVGMHYLFYKEIDDKNLLDFKNALARKEPIEKIQATHAYFDVRLVSILRPYLKSGEQKSIARQLLLTNVGMTATALMLPEEDAIPFLKNEYQHGNRVNTVTSIGTVGGPEATKLLKTAIADTDKGVRRVAVRSLRFFGTDESLRVLTTAVGDDDVEVRKAVAEAFSWTDDEQARKGLATDRSAPIHCHHCLYWLNAWNTVKL
jgi:hypothetical protein